MNFVKFTKISSKIVRLFNRPILSSTYKLPKFLVPLLKSLTSNDYTSKDSFAFSEEIVEQDSEFFFFFFNGKLYKQVDVVAMGSPLGPILAYAFLVNLLYKCSSEQGLITTSGMLMNSLSWLPNQNI